MTEKQKEKLYKRLRKIFKYLLFPFYAISFFIDNEDYEGLDYDVWGYFGEFRKNDD